MPQITPPNNKQMQLNEAQQKAVHSTAASLLIVAGAGTGKTKTLTSRIAHTIAEGADPGNICALTFTNKAAKEMKARVAHLLQQRTTNTQKGLPHHYEDMFIGTFHSWGAKFLKQHHAIWGRTNNYLIYDDADSLYIVRTILKGMKKSGDHDSEELKPARVLEKISAIKNGWVQKEALLASSYPPDVLYMAVYEKYEEQLAANNAFDFDDLLEKTVRTLKSEDAIREKLHHTIKHLFVDEYQDINQLQHQLIQYMHGPECTITVVGDDAQTIYTWRGSDINIFLNFEKQFKNTEIIFLEQNYRSHKIILDAAQAVIAHNANQKKKTLNAHKQEGELIDVIETETETQESGIVSEKIQSLKSHNGSEKTIAVLYRTNAQSRAIEQALVTTNIPYVIYGGIKFYDRKEIKDTIAALRIMYNPKDAVSFSRLETAFTKKRFAQIASILETSSSLTPEEAIRLFLEKAEYGEYIQKYLKNTKERKENLLELLRFAQNFNDLGSFLEQVSLVQANDIGIKARNPVQLMSIHSAKGLEFDYVFLIGAQEKVLPHQMSVFTKEQLEEERRLLYVAITRAKQHLTISYWGQPSRFLFEIPQELTYFQSLGFHATRLDDSSDERYISFD